MVLMPQAFRCAVSTCWHSGVVSAQVHGDRPSFGQALRVSLVRCWNLPRIDRLPQPEERLEATAAS
jgi:hypothetical protein